MFTFSVFSQNYERLAPKEGLRHRDASPPILKAPDSSQNTEESEIIIQSLQSIWFASNPEKMNQIAVSEKILAGLFSVDLPLLKEARFQNQLKSYFGKPASMKTLREIARKTVQYYALKNSPVVDVWIPEQEDVSAGHVRMIVSEAKIGAIKVTGNHYFKKTNYFDAVHLKEGKPIDSAILREDIRALNRNPFNQVSASLSPGGSENVTNIQLQVKDRFPAQFYTGYEDTGTALTGSDRLYAGVFWGDAFQERHRFGYQFTTSPDLEMIRAHSANYTIPLPNYHEWSIQGSYAETKADVVEPFRLKGKSWTVGTRYMIPLRSGENWSHEMEGGFDFKQTNSNLDFGQSTVFQHLADINNYLVGYRWKMNDPLGKTEASLHGFYNPGEGTSNNHDQAIKNLRSFAEAQYFYAQGSLKRTLILPADFRYVGHYRGQYTSDALPPSEMWNVGGWESVRGYEEYAASGDRGWVYAQELQTPGIHIGNWVKEPGLQDELRFHIFYDLGWSQNLKTFVGEKEDHFLIGTGIGLRYSINTYMNLRFDYGFQLKEKDLSGLGNQRAHLGVVLSY